MITPLPGVQYPQAGLGRQAAAGHRRRGARRGGQRGRPGEQGLLALRRPWPGMLRTLYKDPERFMETYFSKWDETTYFVGDAARSDEDGYFWVDRPRRRRDQRLRPPALDRRGRVGDRVAPEGRRGRGDRPAGRGHRPGDRRVRDPRGRASRATDELEGELREHVADADRQARAARSGSSGPPTCRRRARARSCAGCCATSPRGASWAT